MLTFHCLTCSQFLSDKDKEFHEGKALTLINYLERQFEEPSQEKKSPLITLLIPLGLPLYMCQ